LTFIGIFTPEILAFSVEDLIAGYYLILCISIFSNSPYIKGIGIVLCLLSRYSLILWIPLYCYILFISERKKELYKSIAIVLIGIMLIYGPFISRDVSIFSNSYNYYSSASLNEWKGQLWQKNDEKPYQLFSGVGLAGIFYDLGDSDIVNKFQVLRLSHFFLCLIVIIVLGVIFKKNKHKVDHRTFALTSLKVYLTIFYHFIQVPYDYLFMTLLFVSLPIIVLALLNIDRGPLNRILA
jgi:hypothetical protein